MVMAVIIHSMGTVYRFKVSLDNWNGGPGRNTWHMAQAGELGGAAQSDLEGMAADIQAVYTAVAGFIVSGVTIDIEPVVEGFDVATGNLVSVTGIVSPDQVVGSASSALGNLSRATQACVRLKTDAIRGNRVLQGRHFIGPLSAGAFNSSGQIDSADKAAIEAAYGGVLDVAGNGRLGVWGQPNPDVPALNTGVFGYVQQAVCNLTPGTLRSRKN